jgi:hypothetical protein
MLKSFFEAILQVLIPGQLFGWQDSGKSIGTGRTGHDQRDVPRISQPMTVLKLLHVRDILQAARRGNFQ